jgi:hypothetical protein
MFAKRSAMPKARYAHAFFSSFWLLNFWTPELLSSCIAARRASALFDAEATHKSILSIYTEKQLTFHKKFLLISPI